MDLERASILLNRQHEIYKTIEKLNLESLMINEELEKYLLTSEDNKQRPKRREFLESLGFKVDTKHTNGTHLYIITSGLVQHTIMFKQSKFYPEPSHNAWYTFNPDTDKLVDFVILDYLTINDTAVYAVIPKVLFSEIAKKASAFSDGRFNLFLHGDDTKANVRDSNIDLTGTLNNFDILRNR